MLSLYVSFSLFSFVASITPGPTNVIALSYGGKLGMTRILPFILGASLGTGCILLLTAMGLTEFLFNYPLVKPVLGFIGASWLSVMAYKLFHLKSLDASANFADKQGLSWFQGCGLQFVNPKSWMMSVMVASLFPSQGLSEFSHYLVLAAIFSLIAVPCICVWAYLGKLANHHIESEKQQLKLNQTLAILLFLSVWWAFLQA